MERKGFLRMLLLFLAVSFILTTFAVPTTRSLKPTMENSPAKGLLKEGAMDLRDNEEKLVEKEGGGKGEVDMEPQDLDYGPPHANHRKPPPQRE